MKIDIVAFTTHGCSLAKSIVSAVPESAETAAYYKMSKEIPGLIRIEGSLDQWTKDSFQRSDAIIFVGATGIAVRMIAPYVKSKTTDPAVISVDDKGQYMISLLSGHIGGGNSLTAFIAEGIGATPIISTATDINEVFSVDSFAVKNGYTIKNVGMVKVVSAMLLDGEEVGLHCTYPIEGELPKGISRESGDVGIMISENFDGSPFKKTLMLCPKDIVLGIGCRKGISVEVITSQVSKVLKDNGIDIEKVASVASVDLKRSEEGLLRFCEAFSIPIAFYTSDELKNVPGNFTPSQFVEGVVGVDNVCERSAVLGSDGGELIVKKVAENGVTVAIARKQFIVRFGD